MCHLLPTASSVGLCHCCPCHSLIHTHHRTTGCTEPRPALASQTGRTGQEEYDAEPLSPRSEMDDAGRNWKAACLSVTAIVRTTAEDTHTCRLPATESYCMYETDGTQWCAISSVRLTIMTDIHTNTSSRTTCSHFRHHFSRHTPLSWRLNAPRLFVHVRRRPLWLTTM